MTHVLKKTDNLQLLISTKGKKDFTFLDVMFKNCDSDLDCTLDKPECDTKNNICVQKYKFMGGKTRQKKAFVKKI